VQTRDLTWVFSFENVCTGLGIDSDYLRDEPASLADQAPHRLREAE